MTVSNESTVTKRLFIHAPNIHQGGGKSLLCAIIQSLPDSEGLVLVLDARLKLPFAISPKIKVKKVLPTFLNRSSAEMWLRANVKMCDTVLCLGNMPPLFKSEGRVVVFLQNRFLIDDADLNGLSAWSRLRINIERLWLVLRMKSANEFIVQTQTMKRILEKKLTGIVPIRILPFAKKSFDHTHSSLVPKEKRVIFDFIYVASGEPHKNHRVLLEAWSLLAADGLFPSLCLTLNAVKFCKLAQDIDIASARDKLAITNVGELPHEKIIALYKSAGALIYPSKLESFGLPLVEARQMGLAILASELDYVRDLVNPEQSFDPESAISIARAVKRFMDINPQKETIISSAHDFISSIY